MTIARKHLAMPAVILGALLAGALYTYFAGEDINWDWRNYHEYGAYALLNGRFDLDVAPGGFQTFLNPLAYVPPYLLRHFVGAPYWGLLLGAIHGLNLALIYWVSRGVLGHAARPLALIASLVIAAFGPMTLSEVGTSFADILTALPIIAGVGLILFDGERQQTRLMAAGLLIGAAAGLKLTNMTFLIGAGVSLLLVARPLQAMLAYGAGSAAGALATGGVWAYKLWAEFGSPVFPFYNAIFGSPEAPAESIVDVRFMPHDLLDALAYPFYWLIGDHRSSEWPFRDPRFAVVIILLALTIGIGFFRKVEVLRPRDKQFLLLFWVSYVLWLRAFSIHRYAIALELLTAPLIVLLLSRLVEALEPVSIKASLSRVTDGVTAVVALAIAIWSQPADWSRRPWSDPYRPQLAGALLTPATYLMLQKPLGYIVPVLPTSSRVYQLSDIVMPIVPDGSLDHRIRAGLAHPLPGGAWALHLKGSPARVDLLDPYDLQIDAARTCESIPGADGVDIEACPLARRSKPSTSAAGPSAGISATAD
ncbi:glycosyltransferase 87 family protein [Bradyrhizobium sp. STM 3562]|uniref:glycosyltransferase 87 family protein n=1 Tax=Bradyrhizobium sp. STM 3562 TaxID=578924 RepID=UPI00388F4C25